MTRKKFKKQLMAHGYMDRNRANDMAVVCVRRGMNYDKCLGLFLTTLAMLINGQDPSILYTAPGGGGA